MVPSVVTNWTIAYQNVLNVNSHVIQVANVFLFNGFATKVKTVAMDPMNSIAVRLNYFYDTY